VKAFEVVGAYCLRVEFADGLMRVIDFRPVLEGELYVPLCDLSVFNAVALDRDAHTLVWPNGADFDPATLHDWPAYEAEMAAMARRWASTVSSSEKAR
jgi:hypothetical protein